MISAVSYQFNKFVEFAILHKSFCAFCGNLPLPKSVMRWYNMQHRCKISQQRQLRPLRYNRVTFRRAACKYGENEIFKTRGREMKNGSRHKRIQRRV